MVQQTLLTYLVLRVVAASRTCISSVLVLRLEKIEIENAVCFLSGKEHNSQRMQTGWAGGEKELQQGPGDLSIHILLNIDCIFDYCVYYPILYDSTSISVTVTSANVGVGCG